MGPAFHNSYKYVVQTFYAALGYIQMKYDFVDMIYVIRMSAEILFRWKITHE